MLTTSIGEWIVFSLSLIYKSARCSYNNNNYNAPGASFTDPAARIAVHNASTGDNGKITQQRQNTQETIIFDKAFVGIIYNVIFRMLRSIMPQHAPSSAAARRPMTLCTIQHFIWNSSVGSTFQNWHCWMWFPLFDTCRRELTSWNSTQKPDAYSSLIQA